MAQEFWKRGNIDIQFLLEKLIILTSGSSQQTVLTGILNGMIDKAIDHWGKVSCRAIITDANTDRLEYGNGNAYHRRIIKKLMNVQTSWSQIMKNVNVFEPDLRVFG